MEARWIGSPNRKAGRRGYKPEAIVIHVMEGTLAGTDAWFRRRDSKVSAHYGVGRGGELHQYVDEGDTAWHAGRKSADAPWPLLKPRVNPNYYTIGIEHEGRADDPWSDAMYGASAALIVQICHRWDIPIARSRIIGHREIYTAKTCPGSRASLRRLVGLARDKAGLSDTYNFVPDRGRVTALKTLNIRKGLPTTSAPRAGRAAPGTELRVLGWTSNGQAVNGNAHWYRTADGDYFWAGATDQQIPGLRWE